MKWLWTWDGQCFGYRDHEDLWTYDGKHVGKISGTDIYDSKGDYLGEIINKERLITCKSKKHDRGYSFTPYANREGITKNIDYAGYAMYVGYEDFPKLEGK
ncbi:MAG: hypothetical protein CVU90_07555 [Firmicutes bacterium HGW-Firmicutes-15]|nr:MAG: hypothetical protein CVU90_07555 [Firmicutes bacterium HGW-Firmicutes-15]